jgi:hypothetical protein
MRNRNQRIKFDAPDLFWVLGKAFGGQISEPTSSGGFGKLAAESSGPTPPKTAANLPFNCLRGFSFLNFLFMCFISP